MAAAERIAEYLKQCGVFYLATLDGIWPRLRPMNNVCVCGGVIHFLFNKDDEIYGQLLLNDARKSAPPIRISRLSVYPANCGRIKGRNRGAPC